MKVSRRNFLRTSGLVAAGGALSTYLPVLSSLRADAEFPTRVIVWMVGCGHSGDYTTFGNWGPVPKIDGSYTIKPGSLAEALTPWTDKVSFVRGLNNQAGKESPFIGPHPTPLIALFSGKVTEAGNAILTTDGNSNWGHRTFDEYVADATSPFTPFRSMDCAAASIFGPNPQCRPFHLSDGLPKPLENDPRRVWDRFFGSEATLDGIAGRRKAVLDATSHEIQRINAQVSAEDRAKLELHLASIASSVEALERGIPDPTCGGVPPEKIDAYSPGTFVEVWNQHMDNMVLALSCDLTRVCTLMVDEGIADLVYSFLDPSITSTYHDLSHRPLNDAVSQAQLRKVGQFWYAQFAKFLEKLDAVKEGSGTLLDHSLVVLCPGENGDAQYHKPEDMPLVIAGGANGRVRLGRYIERSGQPYNEALVTFLTAATGDETGKWENFGDFPTGPIPGLLV